MDELTPVEEEALLKVIKSIHTYKCMQARGYKKRAEAAKNERIKQLLQDLSADEASDSEYWLKRIHEFDSTYEISVYLLNARIELMMRILGTRGFFEWTIIAEDESVESLALLAENLHETAASEKWMRIASDERLHIERIKKEVLGMETWEMGGGGGVRDVIFGANDGLVSILALVAGVYGAIMESHPILIAGIAGAVAGAISMGAGAYLSSKSEQEVIRKETQRKGIRRRTPEEEKEELVRFYKNKGFKNEEAEAIASRVLAKMESQAEYTIGEELGLVSEEAWPPGKAGALTGLSFAVASLVPVVPFAFMEVTPAVLTASAASVLSLFAVGASKAIFTRKNWIISGLEMMAIGTLAAAATYLIGLVIPV